MNHYNAKIDTMKSIFQYNYNEDISSNSSAGSEARLSWAGGGWLGAASRSCSTWVAVGDSRLPSPHRPAAPAPPPPADLLQALNNKVMIIQYLRQFQCVFF